MTLWAFIAFLVSTLLPSAYGLTDAEIAQFKCQTRTEEKHIFNLNGVALSGYECEVSIEKDDTQGTYIINSNSIPDHSASSGAMAASIYPTYTKVRIPMTPEAVTPDPEAEPEGANYDHPDHKLVTAGAIGIMKNGVFLLGWASLGCCDSASKHVDRSDQCNGKPDMNGRYQYQKFPTCMTSCKADTEPEFLGVAFDGFPIYSPKFDEDGIMLDSSNYDECHGLMETINGVETYRYYMSTDWPYTLRCFRGKPIIPFGLKDQVGLCNWDKIEKHCSPNKIDCEPQSANPLCGNSAWAVMNEDAIEYKPEVPADLHTYNLTCDGSRNTDPGISYDADKVFYYYLKMYLMMSLQLFNVAAIVLLIRYVTT